MRKELFNDLSAKLLSINESGKAKTDNSEASYFKTIKLYNRQVEFVEQGEVFDVPAVFIEIQPIKHAGGTGKGIHTLNVILHVVNSYTTDEDRLNNFDLLDNLPHFLKSGSHPFINTESDTNNDHEELVEDVESYSISLLR